MFRKSIKIRCLWATQLCNLTEITQWRFSVSIQTRMRWCLWHNWNYSQSMIFLRKLFFFIKRNVVSQWLSFLSFCFNYFTWKSNSFILTICWTSETNFLLYLDIHLPYWENRIKDLNWIEIHKRRGVVWIKVDMVYKSL